MSSSTKFYDVTNWETGEVVRFYSTGDAEAWVDDEMKKSCIDMRYVSVEPGRHDCQVFYHFQYLYSTSNLVKVLYSVIEHGVHNSKHQPFFMKDRGDQDPEYLELFQPHYHLSRRIKVLEQRIKECQDEIQTLKKEEDV